MQQKSIIKYDWLTKEDLTFTQESLDIIGHGITLLKNVKKLNIKDLTKGIPHEIFSLTQLERLDIGEKYDHDPKVFFVHIRDEIKNLVNLDIITFNNVNLWYFPDSFFTLPRLRIFGIENVNPQSFWRLSLSLGKLPKLEVLSIWKQNLELPNFFPKLKRLKTLQIAYSKVSNWTDSFESLTELTKFQLINTVIPFRPTSLCTLKNLQHIEINELDTRKGYKKHRIRNLCS